MHVPVWGRVVAVMRDGLLRARLQRALSDRNRARVRTILLDGDALACRSCTGGDHAMRVYPEPGWGVTVICEPHSAGCGGAHSVLLD